MCRIRPDCGEKCEAKPRCDGAPVFEVSAGSIFVPSIPGVCMDCAISLLLRGDYTLGEFSVPEGGPIDIDGMEPDKWLEAMTMD